MTPAQHADAFAARWNGKYINEDGYYGSQCWDVVARYAREEYGCPSFPTVSGGAEGLYRIAGGPILKYFRRVSVAELKKGDIAVWSASFYPPSGHTALVLDTYGSSTGNVLLLEQNGANDPNGDGNADGVTYKITRSRSGMSGGLRPLAEGEQVSKSDINIARILAFAIGGRDGQGVGGRRPNAVNGDTDGDLNANHVNQETNALIWNWWNSAEANSYRNQEIPQVYAMARQTATVGEQLSKANSTIQTMQAQITVLDKRPTEEQVAKLKKTADDAVAASVKAQAELEKIAAANAEAEKAGNAFMLWIGGIIDKIAKGINK